MTIDSKSYDLPGVYAGLEVVMIPPTDNKA